MASVHWTGAAALAAALAWAPAAAQAPAAEQAQAATKPDASEGAPAPTPVPAPAPTVEAFHDEIVQLYGRVRSGMPYEQTVALAAQFEALWDRARRDEAGYLPLLRAEMAREGNPPFFYFDGAELLRALSHDRADMELALSRVERMDMNQVDPGGYLQAVSWFANNGYDTRRAAFQFLDRPAQTFTVDRFPHILQTEPLEAMVFTLFPMEEERFVGDLIARLPSARGDAQLFRLLHCIWATATPQGRAALQSYADDRSHPRDARRYAREMLTHRGEGGPPAQSEAELRAARRAVLENPFTHHSFERFHAITDELVKVAH